MYRNFFLILVVVLFFSACKRGPKIISSPVEQVGAQNSNNANQQNTGIFTEKGEIETHSSDATNNILNSDVHTVKVNEVLPTSKYVYLKVTEGAENFWIATANQEVSVGETYFYKGGLMKTNFESKEYNRVFEKVFLVSKIVPVNHSGQTLNTNQQKTSNSDNQEQDHNHDTKVEHTEGYTKIADLVKKPSLFAGKEIKLIGKCVKLNPNIMGRNWIHLKDGTDDNYDLVITSDTPIPEGHIVKLKGTVAVDLDFGAGYKYDILVENAQVINE